MNRSVPIPDYCDGSPVLSRCAMRRPASGSKPCLLPEMPLAPAGQGAQSLIEFALFAAELLRYLYLDLEIHIPLSLAGEMRQSLVPQTHHRIRLDAGGNLHLRLATFQCRYFQFSSQNGVGKEQRLLPPEIGTVTLETRVRPGAHHDIKVASHPTRLGAGHASPGHAQSHPIFYPHGNGDRQPFGFLDLAAAAALRAGLADRLAAAMADRAGADLPHRHIALLVGRHLLATALAGSACLGRPGIGG